MRLLCMKVCIKKIIVNQILYIQEFLLECAIEILKLVCKLDDMKANGCSLFSKWLCGSINDCSWKKIAISKAGLVTSDL